MSRPHLTGWYGTPLPYCKAQGERYHSLKRAREHYGLDLGEVGYREACDAIERAKNRGGTDDAICFGRQSLTITYWRVQVRGVWMDAVYTRKRHQIVTFLPAGTFERRGLKPVGEGSSSS
jgi:hypothetical protein